MISTDNLSLAQSPQPFNNSQGGVRNVVTDLISSNLSSRIIPKIGSIVKRFSLNYSGEGLVTDHQRVRTVRVGIRFQVQVDSFLDNRGDVRPRAITRTNSAPPESIEFYNQQSNIDICENNRALCGGDNISSGNINNICNRQLEENSPKKSPTLQRNYNSVGNVNIPDNTNCSEVSELDSSSGVSSLAGSNSQSPVASRRHSSSLSFHNRINQALTLYRSQIAAVASSRGAERRSSVQVLRRGSITPEKAAKEYSQSTSPSQRNSIAMEDASSYQVLRYFPGSNVNSARDFNWETAAFEKDVQDRVRWLGDKFSSMRVPPIVSKLFGFLKDYALENPVTSILILAVAITCSLPISIFLGFAVATILFSFIGFLLVEGTLLTVASVSLAGVVLVLGLITLGVLFVGFLGYSSVSQIYSFTTGGSDLKDLLCRLPIIGYFFSSSSEEEKEEIEKVPKSNGTAYKMSNGHVPSTISEDEDFLNDDDDEDVESLVEEDEDYGDEDEDEGNVDDDAISSDLSSHDTMEDDNNEDDNIAQETQSDESEKNFEPLQDKVSPRPKILTQMD